MSAITDQISNLPKPNCAVMVNDNYLEDLVHGYRTHAVTGRNTISMDLTEVTIGNSNGARYRRKRDESRDLTVSFGLTAEDEWAIHKQSELLQKFLNEPESKFIFADEPDMYWVGTVSDFSEDWVNAAGSDIKAMTGEFTIHCSDPYRHSTTITEVTTNGLKGTDSVKLTNNGSVPVPLFVEAYMWDGTKYVGYSLDKDESKSFAYILGSASDSTVGSTSSGPVTVLEASFASDPSWTPNAGILPPITTTAEQTGTMGFSTGAYASDWGSGSYWHGPTLSHIVTGQNGSYPVNWRADYAFDFDASPNGAKAQGLHAVTFADGGGDPLVSVVMVDSKDDTNTEVRAYINRTMYVMGTVPNNDLHVATGGNVQIQKMGSDVTISYSLPIANRNNIVERVNKGGSNGTVELRGTANSNWNSGLQCTYYAWFKEASVDANANKSTIQWAANCVQSGVNFVGAERQHAGIINVYVNGTCVCSEYVPIKYRAQGEVWQSGWRTFDVVHDASGKKNCEVKIDFDAGVDDVGRSVYYWADGSPYSTTLVLSNLEKKATQQVNTSGYKQFTKSFTIGNPDTAIRQVTYYTAALGDDYSEQKDGDGNVTSTSGHQRFNWSKLRSLKIVKYDASQTIAKDHSVFFASGDSISVDSSTNDVRQNGNRNLNMVDITSEPLMLYPGDHTLKVVVDHKTANRPPTLLITYREQWK